MGTGQFRAHKGLQAQEIRKRQRANREAGLRNARWAKTVERPATHRQCVYIDNLIGQIVQLKPGLAKLLDAQARNVASTKDASSFINTLKTALEKCRADEPRKEGAGGSP
jgi:hypothetical protein